MNHEDGVLEVAVLQVKLNSENEVRGSQLTFARPVARLATVLDTTRKTTLATSRSPTEILDQVLRRLCTSEWRSQSRHSDGAFQHLQ